MGRELLAEAVRAYGMENAFALGTRLRRRHRPDLVAAALTQAELRRRARSKFDPADADRMFFTVEGLVQATRASVSADRARRVAERVGAIAATTGAVADLCCGIGGDLIALIRAGLAVTGVDSDSLRVAVARANLDELGLAGSVVAADVRAFARTFFAAVTCDPARRTDRGRVFDPAAYEPPWPFVEELLRGTACVKVAPGIPHDLVPPGVEAEWVSDAGDAKEAALWSGALAGNGGIRRRATLLPAGTTVTDAEAPAEPDLAPPGRWLIEPDAAVIRAGSSPPSPRLSMAGQSIRASRTYRLTRSPLRRWAPRTRSSTCCSMTSSASCPRT